MLHANVIRLIEMYAAERSRSPHTVGRFAAGSGDFYARLLAGHDLTTRRAARAIQWLADHWPEDLDWPTDIRRPAPSEKGVAA